MLAWVERGQPPDLGSRRRWTKNDPQDTTTLTRVPRMLDPYLPMVLLFALAGAFALFSVTAAPYIGPRRYNRAKLEAYECGIEPSPAPVVGGGRMPVAYYLTAMLFILFDIEMVFLYPFAVSADALGLFGLVEIVLFIVTVGFAYIYVWRRGGLDWN
jgi:NADH-quinone oxidoreductase subunit A